MQNRLAGEQQAQCDRRSWGKPWGSGQVQNVRSGSSPGRESRRTNTFHFLEADFSSVITKFYPHALTLRLSPLLNRGAPAPPSISTPELPRREFLFITFYSSCLRRAQVVPCGAFRFNQPQSWVRLDPSHCPLAIAVALSPCAGWTPDANRWIHIAPGKQKAQKMSLGNFLADGSTLRKSTLPRAHGHG